MITCVFRHCLMHKFIRALIIIKHATIRKYFSPIYDTHWMKRLKLCVNSIHLGTYLGVCTYHNKYIIITNNIILRRVVWLWNCICVWHSIIDTTNRGVIIWWKKRKNCIILSPEIVAHSCLVCIYTYTVLWQIQYRCCTWCLIVGAVCNVTWNIMSVQHRLYHYY